MRTIIIKEDEDVIITENLLINQFINMSYWDFEKWIVDKINIDDKYVTDNKDFYGIRLVFSKKIIENLNKKYKIDTLEYLKPKYPWKEELLKEIKLENYIKDSQLEKIKKKIENNEKKEDIISYINKILKK
jgi:hypothetical protein